ncbi:MAG: tail fiber domain-containing protein [Cyanobacteria bacterium P01_D01_bin.115]
MVQVIDTIKIKGSLEAIPPTALAFRELAFSFPDRRFHIGTDDDSVLSGYLSARSDDDWETWIADAVTGYSAPQGHGHSYAPVNHNHGVAYFQPHANGRQRLQVRYNTNSSSAASALDTDGRCKYFHWSGNVRFAVQVDATWLFISPDPSDRRFKRNIEPEDSPEKWGAALQGLLNLPLVSYDWDTDQFPVFDGARTELGVIAQDLEAINPTLVMTDPDGFKHVDVSKTIPYLVASIKALDHRLKLVESQLLSHE